MRVTNSMLVNNLMNNLNNNLARMDKLQGQLASGRKFGHISDDPIALIYAQAARSRLHSLSHYQGAVQSAQDWLRQVESGVMELQGRVADVYNEIINAATDVKGLGETSDKRAIAMLIEQLRDHYLDTLNATFGDKYMYAGYNTPGDSKNGKITGPFTLVDGWKLHYNGQDLSNMVTLSINGTSMVEGDAIGMFGGLKIDVTRPAPDDAANQVSTAITNVNNLLTQLHAQNAVVKAASENVGGFDTNITSISAVISRLEEEINNLPENFPELSNLKTQLAAEELNLATAKQNRTAAQTILTEEKTKQETMLQDMGKFIYTDIPTYDTFGRVSVSIAGRPLLLAYDPAQVNPEDGGVYLIDPISPGDTAMLDMNDKLDFIKKLQGDVLSFDVAQSVNMKVTINGIDLALFQGSDGKTLNIFNVLHDGYKATEAGAGAEEIGNFIRELQDSQNHLLTKVAEIGGRTRRLDLLSARYEQDYINYEQMKSNAEDADFAEVIMNQKMAEAVYQAALSAGARIIQPTLMDFLR